MERTGENGVERGLAVSNWAQSGFIILLLGISHSINWILSFFLSGLGHTVSFPSKEERNTMEREYRYV